MCILFHIPFHHKPYSINNKPYSIMVYHRMLSTFLFKYLFVYLGVLGLSGKIPWRRKGQPTPVFLPGESHGLKRPSGHRVLVVACRIFVASGILLHLSLWHTDSPVVVWGLSCSEAHEILVPRPGIKPESPAFQDGFLTTGPPL